MNTAIEALMAGVALVAGWALRWLAQQREWAKARRIARAELNSPDPSTTNDPEEAIERAVISLHRPRIRSESRALLAERHRHASTSDSNGHGHKTPAHGVRKADD